MIGGIANESGFIRLHKEEQLIAVHEPSAESFVYSGLSGQFSVAVHRGVKGIVRRSHVVREQLPRKVRQDFGPIVVAKRLG